MRFDFSDGSRSPLFKGKGRGEVCKLSYIEEANLYIKATMKRYLLMAAVAMMAAINVQAQTEDDDIWKEFKIDSVDYQKKRSYCMRIYGY